METMRILALSPAGSMERVLCDLRGELYRRWGAVSALALPSLIPIRRWYHSCSRAEAAALLADAASAQSVCLSDYERVEGYLFMSVAGEDLGELWRRLDGSLESVPLGPEQMSPDLFPIRRGFLLAGPDLTVPLEELRRSVPIPAERRFGSYGLSVMCVRAHAPRDRWWDMVSWEEEVYVPVKRSGRAAPGSGARRPARS